MFERLKVLASQGKLTPAMIDNAIAKGWITNDQAAEIRSLLDEDA